MHNGLGQLRQLLHAQRISIETAITSFAEANVKERFMGTLERSLRRQTRKFGHQADEMHRTHFGNKRISFRHIADERADLLGISDDVAAEDVGSAGSWWMKPEQGMNQRSL